MLRNEDLLIIANHTILVKNKADQLNLIENLESLINSRGTTEDDFQFLQKLLQNAIVLNKEKILDLVLGRGLPIDGLVNTYGIGTPLCAAAWANDPQSLNYLIKRYAHIDHPQKHGRRTTGYTPLHSAAISGALEAATILLDAGALVDPPLLNLDNCDPYGTFNSTPLHFACENGHENVVDLLIKRGADVNARDRNGYTPLHYAASRGYETIVKKLLDARADPLVKDFYGHSTLYVAIRRQGGMPDKNPALQANYPEVINNLIEIGVQVCDEDVSLALDKKNSQFRDSDADDIYSLVSANNKPMPYSSSPNLLHAPKKARQTDDSLEHTTESTNRFSMHPK